MPLDIKTLSRYRLERANEDLLAAETNHQAGLYKAAINRSYYAIFHAIRAVNILDNFDASKHSSVIAHFNQFYIHKGEFERGLYKIIDSAYRIREKSDYSDFFIASREDSEMQLEHAHDFVRTVNTYLENKM
ncbi:MAG: HEPN domain-containing protein [Muribaculaceae bacterium]|nr:HEPN domain-containing protein [Roseburia sp.]MCM1430680.1 HEPN domain-containing protein [Muribaculaceae bacterium]MCM1491947.1 HEPN domain-containing protein [Muribaculaceae bacterium]